MLEAFLLLLFLVSSSEATLKCKLPGACTGFVNDANILDSYDQCLEHCKSKDQGTCNWITFNEQNKFCLDFSDCPEIDDTCKVCASGERDCVIGASCNLLGTCQGHILSYNVTSSLTACLETCQGLPACAWYSSHTDNSICTLTSDCLNIDESCQTCISGERACFEGELSTTTSSSSTSTPSTTTSSSTTTTLSNPFNRLVIAATGEVINLDEDGKRCPYVIFPFDDFQYDNYGVYLNGKLIICGAGNLSCFSLANYGQDWQPIGETSKMRFYPGDVQLSDTEWWITGGITPIVPFTSMSDTIVYTDNVGFKNYTTLPTAHYSHHVVMVNNTHVMLTGGACYYGGECRGVWMFERASELWTRLPDSGLEVDFSHAGLVTYASGRSALVVAGGKPRSGGFSNSSVIFDLDTETWRTGPDLPIGLYGGASVQLDDTFLIVSGLGSESGTSKSIFKFVTSPAEGWFELPKKLSEGWISFDAFLVPQDFMECLIEH